VAARLQGSDTAPGIGVDIEEVAALPRTSDFRKDEFYRMNFTSGEIAYCILQPDPYSSFAGLFAAKEAIVKAGGFDRSRSFNGMEIDHTPEGKPQYPGYGISISHAGGMAVAVAATPAGAVSGIAASGVAASANSPAGGPSLKEDQAVKKGTASWISWLALLLSVLALVLVLLH
jgi:holo-[acyl-carrier-protein] synthase